MNEKEQSQPDRHVSTRSEANTEKHDFSEVEKGAKGILQSIKIFPSVKNNGSRK